MCTLPVMFLHVVPHNQGVCEILTITSFFRLVYILVNH
jgi:hypothetical protein